MRHKAIIITAGVLLIAAAAAAIEWTAPEIRSNQAEDNDLLMVFRPSVNGPKTVDLATVADPFRRYTSQSRLVKNVFDKYTSLARREMNGKEVAGTAAAALTDHLARALHPDSTSSLPEGTNLYFTTGRASAAAPVQSVAGRTGTISLTTADIGGYTAPVNADWNAGSGLAQILNKPTIPAAPVNADWAAATGLALILNKPAFTRGYDGKEVEIQNNGTYVQWRYVGDTSWINLIALSAINGAPGSNGTNGTDGKTYSCAITGGVRTLEFDKNGANPAPTMTAFAVELRENGTVVTPASYSWSTPVTSLLSGSGSAATFTPTVAGTFVAATDNRVDVAVTYAGTTCRATAPVPCTKVGADGQQGSADTKQQIYTKISAGTTGDVLNTQCGSGDASTFAGRTVRTGTGDIHRTDLCGGQTWIHAQTGDTSASQKLGVKSSAGTALSYFTADGSLVIKGSLTIK